MSSQQITVLAPGLQATLAAGAWPRLPRLTGTIQRLFCAATHTYDYSHHASLGCDAGGMYAFWSNGRNGEDLPGQVQSWCRRDAAGRWGTPQILARSPMLAEAATTAINGGTSEGAAQVTAFYSEYKGRPKDGAGGTGKWSLPVVTGAQACDPATGIWRPAALLLKDCLLNEGPRRTSGGRWLMTGEDHTGRTRIAYSDGGQPDEDSWMQVPVARGAGTRFKNEPSWFERPDGSLALWLRDDGGSHRLWLAESNDQGSTWSAPLPTDIPDATSKCRAGRLSSGLYYLIHNPDPHGQRIPLVISLSADGRTFAKTYILRDEPTAPRLAGRLKGPGYQYPSALECGGCLHIIYSVNKEEVEVQSIPLDEISLG